MIISSMLWSLAVPGVGLAQAQAVDPPISAAAKAEVVEALGRQMKSTYVFPEVADRAAAALAEKSAKGDYASVATSKAFAKMLASDLRALGNDKHLAVVFDPDIVVDATPHAAPSAKEVAEARAENVRDGFGIAKVERCRATSAISTCAGSAPRNSSATRTAPRYRCWPAPMR